MNNNRKSNAALWVVICILALAVIALGLYIWKQPVPADTTDDQKVTGDQSVEADDHSNHSDGLNEFSSENGVTVKIADLEAGSKATSPLAISGEVPGDWSQEGQFTIELVYGEKDSTVIASAVATLSGDGQTTDYVPFTASLDFTPPADVSTGTLIIHRANPSGMAAGDDNVSIAVKF